MGTKLQLLHHKQVIRNNRGFTLTEIMVAVGLVGIVLLGNTIFMNNFLKQMKQFENDSANETELAILNTATVNIIKKSSLSFNRLNVIDDNGMSFYDYYPDMTTTAFGTNGTRTFSFSAADIKSKRAFFMVSSDETDFESIVFDPMHAYSEGPVPTNILADGTITYRGINSIPNITDSSGKPASVKMMTKIFGTRWDKGRIFILTCPTYLRVLKSNNTVDLMTVPKTASFLGKVVGDDLTPLLTSEASVDIINRHPVTDVVYPSLDYYFRTLPTVGGAAPFVKVEPARLLKFEMRANTGYPAGYADLYMQQWQEGAFTGATVVASKVKAAVFSRSSVTLPLINMEIQK
jgi:prepilin-type N-terminal cleavage/methylation domain-containing protein